MIKIIIDEDACHRDGLCASVCPLGIIVPTGKQSVPLPVDDLLRWCIGCGHCVAVCPSGAIRNTGVPIEECQPTERDFVPNPDQVTALMRSRRSVRRFKSEAPSRDLIERMIEMASYAPSGHNQQPVRWIVVQGREQVGKLSGMAVQVIRDALAKGVGREFQFMYNGVVAAWDQGRDVVLHDAPVVVVVHCKTKVGTEVIDAAVALGQMDLAGHSLGLGCCWAGLFQMVARGVPPIMKHLGIPSDNRLMGAMIAGLPKYSYTVIPPRKPPNITWK